MSILLGINWTKVSRYPNVAPIELNVNNLSDTIIKAEHSKGIIQSYRNVLLSCKPIVEKQLKDEKGVKSIKFDYMTDSIIIEFDPSVLTREEIKNRLDKSGYKFVRLAERGF